MPRDRDHDQQDRRKRRRRIKCDCSGMAQRIVSDEPVDAGTHCGPSSAQHSPEPDDRALLISGMR